MKKGGNPIADKPTDSKPSTKPLSAIKFNLSAHNLACFKGKDKGQLSKTKTECTNEIKFLSQLKTVNNLRSVPPLASIERPRAISCMNNFNESVVIMQYDNIDVYIDNSTRKKSNQKQGGASSQNRKKSESDDSVHDEFLQSCVRAVTEETDNSSNPLSLSANHLTPPNLTPRCEDFTNFYEMYDYYYLSKPKLVRNRQSVSTEQSKRFFIDYERIMEDGRTTVMVKNIPNKYTQEMLLEEFTVNYENKFDFFYLPIDKDNDCNVGYAFVNFINTAYLKDFYAEFHEQRWQRYNSPKICNICYARYQGTLQLADHFKHTKVINQKDRKLKPLMGLAQANKIKDIREMIKNQRSQEQARQQ